jgi:hypothetical protein
MSEKINELIKSVKDLKYDSSTGTFETDRRALFEFAELIVRECVEVCKSRVGNRDYNTGRLHCVSDIRERFGLDGMSTEDKKTLIKELLGVKNG